MANWTDRFMNLAQHVAGWSKDRSTKVGAVIADENHRIVSIGYNGFPQGCDDNEEHRHERPVKYLFTEHAERNAIYTAARNGATLKGCTLYVPWFPCADCARAIIQTGITKLVCAHPNFEDERWGKSFSAAFTMLAEAGVMVQSVDIPKSATV